MASDSGSPPEDEDPLYAEIFPASGKLDAYDMAFDDLAVFEAAGHARDTIGQLCTYGFVTFGGMRTLLQGIASRLRPDSPPALAKALAGTRFLDLGSGDGRAVIGAALLAPTLEEAAGLELSVSRHELAVKNHRRLPEPLRGIVRFDQGDILQVDAARLAGADIVWLANLRFPEEVVMAINAQLERDCAVKADAVVATLRECNFTRPHTAWTEQVAMSWNPGGWPVFCYHLSASRGAS